jgi:hypothetical protein
VNVPAFVRLVEVFDAPRERVFAAWTEEEQLKRWWGPGRFVTTRADVDLRPGGRYELVLEPGPMQLAGEFREVVLLHDSFAGPGPVDMYGAGWASGLAKLRAHLGSEEVA